MAVPKAISEAIQQNPGNFRFEACPKLKYFCDWSIKQGQNFEPIKKQNLSKSGREFLVLHQVCFLFLVAKQLKSKDFIVQTLNILIVSLTQVRTKTRKTAQKTYWLKQFEKWAVERKKEVNLEKYVAEELNSTLCEFLAEFRKTNGDDHELDSLRVMFSAIDRHLKSKSYPKSIKEDNIFLPMMRLELATLSYKPSALAIELTSSKAIAGKELCTSQMRGQTQLRNVKYIIMQYTNWIKSTPSQQ